MITIRPADLDDSDMLFKWRNDPDTCANSRSTSSVTQGEHDQWMKFSVMLGYPQHLVFIGDSNDLGAIGVVRFDTSAHDLMTYETSITIAPEYRGRGFAQALLTAGCSVLPEYTLTAEVRATNFASNRAFQRCGFKKQKARNGFVQYRREPQP